MPRASLFRATLSAALAWAAVPARPTAAAAAPPADFPREAVERAVRAHTTFLADDLLEGRGTGTRGHELAARYVAAQFQRLGLKPAGDAGTHLQRLRFAEAHDALEAGTLAIHGQAGAPEFAAVNDVLVRTAAGHETASVRAPAVFVGFGVRAPELKHDDFGDVDLRGKIAVYHFGAPRTFPVNPRAYHSDGVNKARELVRRGAVGVVVVRTPRDEAQYPWGFVVAQFRFPRMRLLDAEGRIVDGFPELRATGALSLAATNRLFAAAGRDPVEIAAKADRGEPQHFDLGFEIELTARATLKTTESVNVVGLLPGWDAAIAAEPLVLTSHLDHIGIGAPVNGDAIYNGAMDNAIGVALLLATAEQLAVRPAAPRPILFAALTGEEKGLLGAEHLARVKVAGVKRFAANLNVDMALFPGPVRDLIPRGAEHSTLGETLARVAAQRGFTVSPDPMPDEVIFVRSDQYPFVKSGVPAIYLDPGERSTDPGFDLAAANRAFLKTRYHQPGDDLTQPVHWPSAAEFAGVMLEFTRAVAEAPAAPAWYAGDFFGDRFAEPEAKRAPRP